MTTSCAMKGTGYTLPGRGISYTHNETVSASLPAKYGAYRNFEFSGDSRIGLRFTRGRPMSGAEAHITHYGADLPDSLAYISTGTGALACFNVELTGNFTEYLAMLSTNYKDSVISARGISENELIVSRWNEEEMKWMPIPASIDTAQNIISFTPDHFSIFALSDTGNHVISALSVPEEAVPHEYSLAQNYPNPFNPETVIRYSLPRAGETEITVYSILGSEVQTLVNGYKDAGEYEVVWNGRDNRGLPVASGIYFYRFKAGGSIESKKNDSAEIRIIVVDRQGCECADVLLNTRRTGANAYVPEYEPINR